MERTAGTSRAVTGAVASREPAGPDALDGDVALVSDTSGATVLMLFSVDGVAIKGKNNPVTARPAFALFAPVGAGPDQLYTRQIPHDSLSPVQARHALGRGRVPLVAVPHRGERT